LKEYTVQEASQLIEMARLSIELKAISPNFNRAIVEKTYTHEITNERVIVKLLYRPTKALIGISNIQKDRTDIRMAVVDAALAAAHHAGNQVVTQKFLEQTIIELSIISDPIAFSIEPRKREGSFVLGKHGVLLEYGHKKNYIMPDDIPEAGTTANFLELACVHAGMPAGYWLQPKVKISKFEIQSFIEHEPGGAIGKIGAHT
jgi:AMMECR1 domain-containing protein